MYPLIFMQVDQHVAVHKWYSLLTAAILSEFSSEARTTCVVVMVLSVEELLFLLENVFWYDGEYTRYSTMVPGTVFRDQVATS